MAFLAGAIVGVVIFLCFCNWVGNGTLFRGIIKSITDKFK